MTLACEDANSKLVEAVTVAHVDAVMKLNLGRDSEARFGQDFDAVMKLNLGRDS